MWLFFFRIIATPVLFRESTKEFLSDTDCKVSQQIFGHPLLLKIPTKLSISELYDILLSRCKLDAEFKLLYVDGQVQCKFLKNLFLS